ncbi:MAG: L-histidine N(alpha)-methyltransferase, partial [Myxococcota bacterium]
MVIGLERALAQAVRAGLTRPDKRLPPWLLYDDEGSRLFERITTLPGYYLTAAERSILTTHAASIARAVAPVTEVVELGAGTATKSEILLAALRAQGEAARFVPVDVSAEPLEEARKRLRAALPDLDVQPIRADNDVALATLPEAENRLVLFLGSSVGNLDDADARALLRRARSVSAGVLLGADLRKSPQTLMAAYDDPVTAAFITNVLTRLNRELGADFDLSAFQYLPVWNDVASRMEMYLRSTRDQQVH